MSQSRFMSAPHLKRALGLWNLVFYGIIMVQPTAPMPVFGIVSETAQGHVVSAVLVATRPAWRRARLAEKVLRLRPEQPHGAGPVVGADVAVGAADQD